MGLFICPPCLVNGRSLRFGHVFLEGGNKGRIRGVPVFHGHVKGWVDWKDPLILILTMIGGAPDDNFIHLERE
jgi:hypothetical protein